MNQVLKFILLNQVIRKELINNNTGTGLVEV